MPNSRHITWIIQGDEPYGIQRAILTLACAIHLSDWKVTIISLDRGQCQAAAEKLGLNTQVVGIQHHPSLHKTNSLTGKFYKAIGMMHYQKMVFAELRPYLQHLNCDALHTLHINILPAVGKLGITLGIPTFWEMINTVSSGYPLNLNKKIYHWILHHYRIHPLANSRHTAESLQYSYTDVLYPGVDPSIFNPRTSCNPHRDELNIPENAVVFGIFARIHPSKGQLVFADALLRSLEVIPDAHLLLVGGPTDSDEAARIHHLFEQHKCSQRLHMVGHSTSPEKYYPIIDIAVNARMDPEPYGLSVVEGMMMEKPLLVHASGGPAETVKDEETGWHMKQPGVESCMKGIQCAVNDRARWRNMGKAGRERALAEFSAEVQAAHYKQIIEDALAYHKSPSSDGPCHQSHE